jgi:hypothetical protein
MTEALQDAKGCLTPAGLRFLAADPAAAVPPGLARHLADCPRCQMRVLAGGEPRPRPAAPARELLPSLGRLALITALLLLAVAAFFWSLKRLTG